MAVIITTVQKLQFTTSSDLARRRCATGFIQKTEKMYVKKGDKVVLNKYAGTEIKYQGEDLIIVKQSDILAIVE